MRKRNFEEAAEAAPAAEAATDPKDKLVEALTAMGLNAEQAEAVFSMAQDLVAADGGGEPAAVEASRQRRARFSRGRVGRSRMSRTPRRSRYSRERVPSRLRRARTEMSESPMPRRERRAELSRRPRRDMMSAEQRVIARQRRQIAMMRRQQAEGQQQPAARKLSNNPMKGSSSTQPKAIQGGSVKERVMNYIKDFI
jgi:hypothetical protein